MANDFFQRQLASYAAVHRDRRNKATHFVGIPVIDGDAERATAHSYLLWIQMGAESPISAAAEYVDSLVKLNGGWVFESRVLTRLAGRA